MAKRPRSSNAFDRLKAAALAYPESWEDHPWGETVIKVKTKIFLFLFEDEDGLRVSLKLPRSREFAGISVHAMGSARPAGSPRALRPGKSHPSMCSKPGSTRATAPWRRRSW